jgi:hypothetical protein
MENMELPKLKNPKLEAHRAAFFKKHPEDIPAYLDSVNEYLARKKKSGIQTGGGDQSWIIEPSGSLLDIIEFVCMENYRAKRIADDPNATNILADASGLFSAANNNKTLQYTLPDTAINLPAIDLSNVTFDIKKPVEEIAETLIDTYFVNKDDDDTQAKYMKSALEGFFNAVYIRLIFRSDENVQPPAPPPPASASASAPAPPAPAPAPAPASASASASAPAPAPPVDKIFYYNCILYIIKVLQRIRLYISTTEISFDMQYYFRMMGKLGLGRIFDLLKHNASPPSNTNTNAIGTQIMYGLQRIPYQDPNDPTKQHSHYMFTQKSSDYGSDPARDVDMWLSYIFMGDDPEKNRPLVGINKMNLRADVNSAQNIATLRRIGGQKGGYLNPTEPTAENPTQSTEKPVQLTDDPPIQPTVETENPMQPTVENPTQLTVENPTQPIAENPLPIVAAPLGSNQPEPPSALEVPSDIVRFSYLDRAHFYMQMDDVPIQNVSQVNVYICIVSVDNSCKQNNVPIPFLKYIVKISADSAEYEFPKFQYSIVAGENDASFRSELFVHLLDTLKLNICLESAQKCLSSQEWTESSEMKTTSAFDNIFKGLVQVDADNLLAVFDYDKIAEVTKQPDSNPERPALFEFEAPEMYPINDDNMKAGLCWGIVDELIFEKKLRGKPVNENVSKCLRIDDSLWLITDTIASKWIEFPFSVYLVVEGEDGKYKSEIIASDINVAKQRLQSFVGNKVEHSFSQKYGDRYCFTLSPIGVDMDNAKRYAVFMWSPTYLTAAEEPSAELSSEEPNEEIENVELPTIYFVENTEKTNNTATIMWGVQKISQIATL